jgi:hypothetical protein
MVFKPLSENIKKIKSRHANEKRLCDAVAAYKEGQQGLAAKKSLRVIALQFNVPKSSLERRAKGGQSIQEFNGTKQKLTSAEEKTLAEFIHESAAHGFPLSHRQIEMTANAVLQSRLGANCECVGKKWIFSFLDRHHERLQTHWSKPLDTQRANSLNPQAVESWFKLVEEFIVKLGILPGNLYGMDESGFPTGYKGKERVVGGRGTKTQHKQGGADRENVTALVTICADGSTLRPMIIFKGQHFMQKWNDNNVAKAQWVAIHLQLI